MAYPYGGPGDQNMHRRHEITGIANYYDGPQSSSYMNYPPLHDESNPSFFKPQSGLNVDKDGDVTIRVGMYSSRTPSPTPSEQALLSRKGVIDWQKMLKWRFWIRREWLWYYVILGIILIIVILITVYDRQIVHWLQPTAETIKGLPAGWLIPIGIFFIISFPPLFGHEILAILCGVVWGLWIGFAITAAGTFLGEMGNFYAFKYCCRARGEKLEKKDLQYACLARTVRQGGFRIALIARYSAIPGHFTTAVFSTCGMGVFVFALAAFLSLPKQFVTVYIGVILEESGTGTETTRDKLISYAVFAVTAIVTCVAMWYMYKKMDEVKGDVIYDRRKARKTHANHSLTPQAKLDRAQSLRGSSVFNPNESESDLPLNPGEDSAHQQWDAYGRATGFSGDPRRSQSLQVPTPQRPGGPNVARIPTYRTESGGGYSTSGERYGSPSAGSYPSSSTTPSQVISPVRSPAPNRQESADSVGWDPAGQVGGEAYRLPTIQPHTPLSGNFVNVPLSSRNPYHNSPLQQAQRAAASDSIVPPPLAPPPGSNQRRNNPYSPPTSPSQPSAYPTAPISSGYASPQHTGTTMSPQVGAAVTASPTTQQFPGNVYPKAQSLPQSPIQTPTQHGFTTPPHPQVHPQVQAMSPQPQYPPGAGLPHTFGYESPSGPPTAAPALTNLAGVGTHLQEASDESVYYTPAHSRSPTGQPGQRLPSPTPPPQYQP